MLFKSEVLTQASGSIGGVTYSRNRGGMYRRARAIPTNPNTGFQQQTRTALTEAVTFWTSELTTVQRAAWDLYAANTPVIGVLGDAINLSGQNMYVRSFSANSQLLQKLGVGRIADSFDVAPSVFNLGDFITFGFTADVSTGLTIAYDDTIDWVTEDGAFMHVFMSRPQNPSVNYYNGPWRLTAAIAGDLGTPPTSPQVIAPAAIATNGYPFVADQNVWIKLRVSRPDNRLTTERVFGPVLSVA